MAALEGAWSGQRRLIMLLGKFGAGGHADGQHIRTLRGERSLSK